jgi:putative flippase GtrA
MEYFAHLYRLYKFRFPGLVEFIKFCAVGLLGLFVDLSIVSLLKELGGVDTRLCQVFGFLAAVTFNYAINRRFSFEHAREPHVKGTILMCSTYNTVIISLWESVKLKLGLVSLKDLDDKYKLMTDRKPGF